jgi:proliferating cell nuclear antigen PCNA
MYLLKIKTKDGHSFKVLSELIQKCIKDGCWTIDKNGMFLTGVDTKTSKGTKMISVDLSKYNFTKYKCSEEQLMIGMNMVHFYRMLKSIKKKDNTLTLFIEENDPLKLYIQINQMGEDKRKGIIGHINITLVRPQIHDKPIGYNDPIIVTSKEFQKVKQLTKISKSMELSFKGKTVDLFCNREGVYSKRVTLGDTEHDEDEDEDEEEEEEFEREEYKQTFDSDQILDLVKTASTSNTIQIYITPDLPLQFKMNVGSLGVVHVYIKSRESIFEEQEEDEEDTLTNGIVSNTDNALSVEM